ncbi:MAG: TetR/AcrR family transcriptional regulator [Candidatus Nanopelagicaceae bacterium]|nr:TetR/AcrR family transcriptional regulator [Candidatus Nanopelagicaceae bacterium]
MTISENPSLLTDEPYQRQMTSYRRTRSAILEGAKSLVASRGLQRANMVDIASIAEVSRATLYNHFRDKPSVMRAVLESEVARLLQIIDADVSQENALAQMSAEISSDPAFATMRKTDAGVIATLLTNVQDPLWVQIRVGLHQLLGNDIRAEVAQRWLVAQVLQPLSSTQSVEQARIVTSF